MSTVQFPVQGTVILHVGHGDVVVKGQAGRGDGQLLVKGPVEQKAPNATDAGGAHHFYMTTDVTAILPPGTAVQILGNPGDVVLRGVGDVVLETCQGDLAGTELASFQTQCEVRGDVALRTVVGTVDLAAVRGDLAIADASAVSVDVVGGDARVDSAGAVNLGKVKGDLVTNQAASVQVREADGDVKLTNIRGAIDLKRVGRDLSVTAPGPSLAASEVRGGVRLLGYLEPDGRYWINASGSVVVKASGDIHVNVRARGHLQVGPEVQVESQAPGVLVGWVGSREHAADLNIDTKGDAVLSCAGQGAPAPAEVPPVDVPQIVAQAQGEAAQALAQAQAEVGRSLQGVAEPDRSHPARTGGVGTSLRSLLRDLMDSVDPQAKPVAPRRASSAPQDEVRTVLEMLAAGKITAEEAEKLIEAL